MPARVVQMAIQYARMRIPPDGIGGEKNVTDSRERGVLD